MHYNLYYIHRKLLTLRDKYVNGWKTKMTIAQTEFDRNVIKRHQRVIFTKLLSLSLLFNTKGFERIYTVKHTHIHVYILCIHHNISQNVHRGLNNYGR
jgi:hypothetical protein